LTDSKDVSPLKTSNDVTALAQELHQARAACRVVSVPPSSREGGFSLDAAYAVEVELTRLRRDSGRVTVGRKVGYANKAVWRALKLQTLVWASMYDDTVRFAEAGEATLPVAGLYAPRIEPEIVITLKAVPASGEAAAVLEAAEWLALGFEIVDAPFPDWKFQPADFVASFGLHAALVVGPPRRVEAGDVPALVEQLASFKVRLSRDGELVEEGFGKNSLRSPALCVAELASAIAGRPGAEPLRPGELVSTGTLTAAHPIRAGESWRVEPEGLDLAPVTLRT
jgi:2-keto-4-pentenoate hydratase